MLAARRCAGKLIARCGGYAVDNKAVAGSVHCLLDRGRSTWIWRECALTE